MNIITLMTQLRKFKNDSKLTSQKVQDLSRQRFTALLKKTYHSSEFYRDLYSSHGIKPKDLSDVAPADLPILDKTMVMDNFDSLIADKSITRRAVEEFITNDFNPNHRFQGNAIIHTSGSTGVPGIFVYSKKEWDFIVALLTARIKHPMPKPFYRFRLAFIGATIGHFAGATLTAGAPKFIYKTKLFSKPEDTEGLIRDMNEFQPDIISGYAGVIHQLALAQLDGRLNIKPKRIQASGEALSDQMRQTVDKAFNIDVVNLYACSESILLGIQKSAQDPFLLFNDWHHIEVVDENDNVVPEGTPGSLLITPLYRSLQPLIRYRMSDTVTLKTTDQPFITLDTFAGRETDALTFIDDKNEKHPIHPFKLVDFFAPGLNKFQFEQTAPNFLLARITVADGYSDTKQLAEKQLMDILKKEQLDSFVSSSVEVVDSIGMNPKTGKFNLIIPFKD
ncbi:MAG: phenylacetate--CoA ligase family protein [Pseudodesulfovibrio sp.]|nr:phenylacetate--CoA ligase family protein [Pseudodesulfovibrio sp.]